MIENTSPVLSTCTTQKHSGRFCEAPAWNEMPFPICRSHAIALYMAMRGIHNEALLMESRLPLLDAATQEERAEQMRAMNVAATAKMDARKESNTVVYYVRIGDHIKIGFTTNLRQRMVGLRLDHDAVLATEPGGRELEAKRHKQFAAIRIGRREDFKPTLALTKHIEAVREFHGAPVFPAWDGTLPEPPVPDAAPSAPER